MWIAQAVCTHGGKYISKTAKINKFWGPILMPFLNNMKYGVGVKEPTYSLHAKLCIALRLWWQKPQICQRYEFWGITHLHWRRKIWHATVVTYTVQFAGFVQKREKTSTYINKICFKISFMTRFHCSYGSISSLPISNNCSKTRAYAINYNSALCHPTNVRSNVLLYLLFHASLTFAVT